MAFLAGIKDYFHNQLHLFPFMDEGTEFTLIVRIDSNVLRILWTNHILSRCIQL